MISSADIAKSIYGAFLLAKANKNGMSYFDTSLDGFWRSFFSAVLVAPIFFFLMTLRFVNGSVDTSAIRFLSIEAIAYIIGWFLFPLIVFYLAQALERESQFIGFIVAYNWASVIQNSVYLPFAILFEIGAVSGGGAEFVNLILLCLVLTYTWFVAKTALNINSFVATGIVFLDVGVWIMLNIFTDSLLKA